MGLVLMGVADTGTVRKQRERERESAHLFICCVRAQGREGGEGSQRGRVCLHCNNLEAESSNKRAMQRYPSSLLLL